MFRGGGLFPLFFLSFLVSLTIDFLTSIFRQSCVGPHCCYALSIPLPRMFLLLDSPFPLYDIQFRFRPPYLTICTVSFPSPPSLLVFFTCLDACFCPVIYEILPLQRRFLPSPHCPLFSVPFACPVTWLPCSSHPYVWYCPNSQDILRYILSPRQNAFFPWSH